MVLTFPEEEKRHHLVGFLGGEVWMVATPWGGRLEMELSTQHFKMDARSWGEASSQTFQTLFG